MQNAEWRMGNGEFGVEEGGEGGELIMGYKEW